MDLGAPQLACWAGRLGLVLSALALGLLGAGCPFGPALPVEDKPNYPPLISEDFVSPGGFRVTIQRSENRTQTFAIQAFLDANEDETLDVVWFAPGVGQGLILLQDIARPLPPDTDKVRDLFTQYEGSSFDLEPCDGRWINLDELVLSVLVSDGELLFKGDTFEVPPDRYLDVYTWTIAFDGTCI